jgi:hypothetical protein
MSGNNIRSSVVLSIWSIFTWPFVGRKPIDSVVVLDLLQAFDGTDVEFLSISWSDPLTRANESVGSRVSPLLDEMAEKQL